jgi:nitroreductase
MELLRAIDTRSSAARLTEPGVTPEHLARILEAAGHAPDHGRLKPWRFIVLEKDLKESFAQAAAEAKRLRVPTLSADQVEAEREKLRRSPTLIVAGCAVRLDQSKVPEIEQVIAVGAAVENLLLAAHDLGYGSMWKTGPAAYDPGVKALLGLKAHDHIVAIVHLGTRLH